ncbi:MAG: hypothetical protein V4450_15090 [Bacteroidota bacterium]
MIKKILLGFFLTASAVNGFSQSSLPKVSQFFDLTGTLGESEGAIAGAYVHNWHLGKKKKWEIGYGVRLTSYFGVKKDYITAPARLSRSSTIPFVVVFSGQETKNWDTLNVQRPFANSFNASVNFGYNFSHKWSAGFNIDVIGFTFGRATSGVLTSNGTTRTETVTKPAAFNLLLTGDNDLGSLNSEFFLKYNLNNRWALKAVYQFLFSEYTTTTIKQTAPDGTQVDRFRNKVNAFGLGITYQLQ